MDTGSDKYAQYRQRQSILSKLMCIDSANLDTVSHVSAAQRDNDNIAYGKQLEQNEKDFMKQQKQYLGQEYLKQQREKEMMQRLEREKKMSEQMMMKREEQHIKSVSSGEIIF